MFFLFSNREVKKKQKREFLFLNSREVYASAEYLSPTVLSQIDSEKSYLLSCTVGNTSYGLYMQLIAIILKSDSSIFYHQSSPMNTLNFHVSYFYFINALFIL